MLTCPARAILPFVESYMTIPKQISFSIFQQNDHHIGAVSHYKMRQDSDSPRVRLRSHLCSVSVCALFTSPIASESGRMDRGMDVYLEEARSIYGDGHIVLFWRRAASYIAQLDRFPSPMMAEISPLLPFIIKADACSAASPS